MRCSWTFPCANARDAGCPAERATDWCWALDAGAALENEAALGGDLVVSAGVDKAEDVACELSEEAVSVAADVELHAEADR